MKKWLGSVTLLLALVACGEEDPPINNAFLDSGMPTTGGTGATTSSTTGEPQPTTAEPTTGGTMETSGTPVDTTSTPVDTTGDSTGGTTMDSTGGGTGTTEGTTGDTTGGTTEGTTAGPVQMDLVSGTWEGCSSYGARMGDMCAGYLCNVTLADVEASLLPEGTGPCSNAGAEKVCGGDLTTVTGRCARQVKSNPLNVLDSNDQLRPKIRDCMYEDPAIDPADTSMECTDCFLDAAECASDFCLTACLAGDSEGCDSCRIENGCNQMVADCAGIPNPF